VGGSQVGIVLPVLFVVLVMLLARGDVQTNIARTRAYLVAMAACAAVAFTAFARSEPNASITSLLLLIVTYLPFCYGLTPKHRATLFPRLLDRFVS
jgi:predicted membrane metal-binding protein